MNRELDICIVGGCGHVGLPLGLAFAERGLSVSLCDIDAARVRKVNDGILPFIEEGAADLLVQVRAASRLSATTDRSVIAAAEHIVMVVGTPVDEHLNPRIHDVVTAVDDVAGHLHDEQLLVLRSTLYPGATDMLHDRLTRAGNQIDIAFCPERIAQGHGLVELRTLPQIVSGCTPRAFKRAAELFATIAPEIIELSPTEAELAKLYANNTRYILFAMANQFFTIADRHGLDYARIHAAVTKDYPRLSALPSAGFAAGPCLFKDTMQLSAFSGGTYFLGHAAMMVNEGLPDYVVERVAQVTDLRDKVVGVLGMAFKPGSDDPRESLSYKLKKKLELVAPRVLCTDVHIDDERFVPVQQLVDECSVIIVATPHPEYKDLDLTGKYVVDIWNMYGNGSLIS